MSRRANTQYTAGGTDFDVVTGNDGFLNKDLQGVQAALEGHDHTATKGIAVGRVGTSVVGTSQLVALAVDSSILANLAVTTAKIADGAVTAVKLGAGAATGAALGSDVVKTTGVQSISGPKTIDSAVLSNITTVDGAIREDRGVDVASASTTTLGDDGNTFLITGANNITTLNVKPAGTVVRLIFSGVLTLTDGAGTLRLNGDFVTANESSITLVSMGSYWQELGRNDVSSIAPKLSAGTYTGNGANPRTIALSFTPKLVIITSADNDGIQFATQTGSGSGVAIANSNNVATSVIALPNRNHPLLTTNGFIVRPEGGQNPGSNNNTVVYTYIAIG